MAEYEHDLRGLPPARLHRAVRYETEMIEVYLQAIPDDMATAAQYGEAALSIPSEQSLSDERVARRLLECILPEERDLNKIMRYESHLNRQLYQAMHEVEALQARRQGGHSPLARLDISAPPVA